MAADAPAETSFRGWHMVGVAFLVDFIAVGFYFYSFGIYYPAIASEFSGATFGVALGISISNLVGGLFGPVIGRALDRYPLRRLMLMGATVVSAGFASLSFIHSVWQYYLVLGTFFAFGLSFMGGMASAKLVANWFAVRRGTALGIATMGVSLSGMLMPTLATWLVEVLGWRGGFRVYAAGILLIVVPVVASLVVTRPEDVGQLQDGGRHEDDDCDDVDPERVWSARELLRTRNFWIIALAFAAAFSSLSAILIHVVPFATDLGVTGYRASWVLSAAAGGGVLGKVVFGHLVDRTDERIAVWASFGTQIVGVLLLLHGGGYAALVLGAVVFGFGMGGVVPLQGALCGKAFGRLSFGTVMGLMRPVQVPLHAVGIPLAAWLREASGSFEAAFEVFLAVYAVSCGLVALLELPTPVRARGLP